MVKPQPSSFYFSVASIAWCLLTTTVPFFCFVHARGSLGRPPLRSKLHNGAEFPLIGLGVGNLKHDMIVSRIVEAMNHNTRLIDTSQNSENNHLVKEGIVKGLDALRKDHGISKFEMHVVTKIWYTYLGYERTKIAVKEILEQFDHPNIVVHILIHWPRCNSDVHRWMKCEEEEAALPQFVKDAGPPAHLHKERAYIDSWRALEDIYTEQFSEENISRGIKLKIAGIGVSNFELDDLKGIIESETNRVVPHHIQHDVWSYVYDPHLVKYAQRNKIHYQLYHVIHSIFYDGALKSSPNAMKALSTIADKYDMLVHQIVFLWLVCETDTHPSVSISPRTSDVVHVRENSDTVIASFDERVVPQMTKMETDTILHCIQALVKREDIDRPRAAFINENKRGSLHIAWHNGLAGEDEEEIFVHEDLKPGEMFQEFTDLGAIFHVYNNDKSDMRIHKITANYGEKEKFRIKMEDSTRVEL